MAETMTEAREKPRPFFRSLSLLSRGSISSDPERRRFFRSFSIASRGSISSDPERRRFFRSLSIASRGSISSRKGMTSLTAELLFDHIQQDDLTSVVNLLESGNLANIEETDEDDQTFLMHAARKGNVDIVRELLEHGADVNAEDEDNWTALLNASKEGHTEVVIELLENGADITLMDMGGWTCLMWACYKHRTDLVLELLERGANPNVKAEHNMTCLIWASGRGYVDVVKVLLENGAKVNTADKYGTTPLIWACRKGELGVVEELLKAGANVDVSGMNSWTALLVAAKGGFTEIVTSLLEYGPSVNVVDKDGFSALMTAAKDGYTEMARDLVNSGAYVNITDRAKDTILIHAVKGGHLAIVQLLLKKHVDIDAQGEDNKTALYWAVEKGNFDIAKALLDCNPDKELCTKDGTTPLLKAVKSKNYDLVNLLLTKGVRVSAVDKKGDNALHIAIRARSRKIVELLLQNPKESRLLYRPNRAGETPYLIDASHSKSIIASIFGARNLNQPDVSENYELYSGSLAECLSEPTLCTPMAVGLFAKWGSGKSLVLEQLQKDMKNFAYSTMEPRFEFSYGVFFLVFTLSCFLGLILGLPLQSWIVGLAVGAGVFILQYTFLGIVWYGSNKKFWDWACKLNSYLGEKLGSLFLLMKLLFCNPPKKTNHMQAQGIRFLFTESMKLSSVGAEKSLAVMVASLCSAVEKEFGLPITRLFRVFKAKGQHVGKYKSICCIPYFVIAIIIILCIVISVSLLSVYGMSHNLKTNTAANVLVIVMLSVVALVMIANIVTWWQMIGALVHSQKHRVEKAAERVDSLKLEGLLQTLKSEVKLLSKMVMCMDAFTCDQTRLVVIVDSMDSCEQDKVLQVLDTVHNLFSDPDTPFITILALDPHIVMKAIESNFQTVFADSNITGHDYLRNMVHLPFYLQSQGMLPKKMKKDLDNGRVPEFDARYKRQESTYSQVSLNIPTSDAPATRKRKGTSGSIFGSSTGSTAIISKYSSNLDIQSAITKSDYFSDVNPRTIRRLVNIVAITGRLLRVYNIDHSRYHLSTWVNLTEQWPYRTSWIIWYFEQREKENPLEDSVTLKEVYDRIHEELPCKEEEPLVEIDRNAHKLEVFLTNSRPPLTVGDLRKFLPCSINIDPYLRKLIKEYKDHKEQTENYQSVAMDFNPFQPSNVNLARGPEAHPSMHVHGGVRKRQTAPQKLAPQFPPPVFPYPQVPYPYPYPGYPGYPLPPEMKYMVPSQINVQVPQQKESLKIEIEVSEPLSSLPVESVCGLLDKLEGLNKKRISEYCDTIKQNNITGWVLMNCELDELKNAMGMTFGDWQLFRAMVMTLREQELIEEEGQSVSPQGKPSSDCMHVTSPLSSPRGENSENTLVPHLYVDQYSSSENIQASPRPIKSDRVAGRQDKGTDTVDTGGQLPGSPPKRQSSAESGKGVVPRNDSTLQQIMLENQILRDKMDTITEGDTSLEELTAQDHVNTQEEIPRNTERRKSDFCIGSSSDEGLSDKPPDQLNVDTKVKFASTERVYELKREDSLTNDQVVTDVHHDEKATDVKEKVEAIKEESKEEIVSDSPLISKKFGSEDFQVEETMKRHDSVSSQGSRKVSLAQKGRQQSFKSQSSQRRSSPLLRQASVDSSPDDDICEDAYADREYAKKVQKKKRKQTKGSDEDRQMSASRSLEKIHQFASSSVERLNRLKEKISGRNQSSSAGSSDEETLIHGRHKRVKEKRRKDSKRGSYVLIKSESPSTELAIYEQVNETKQDVSGHHRGEPQKHKASPKLSKSPKMTSPDIPRAQFRPISISSTTDSLDDGEDIQKRNKTPEEWEEHV